MIRDTQIIIATGKQTVSQICQEYNISISNLLYNNTQKLSADIPGYNSTRSYLEDMAANNLPIEQGVELIVSLNNSNNLNYTLNNLTGSSSIKNLWGNTYLEDAALNGSGLNKLSDEYNPHIITKSSPPSNKYTCCYWIIQAGFSIDPLSSPKYLPTLPPQVTDTNSGSYSSQDMLGRSVPYQIYNTSGRDVSFSLDLHEDLYEKASSFKYGLRGLIAELQSVCYPNYDNNGNVTPMEIAFQLGKTIFIRGVLKECSVSWEIPVIDNEYSYCKLSLSVTETTGPWSNTQITSYGGYRK